MAGSSARPTTLAAFNERTSRRLIGRVTAKVARLATAPQMVALADQALVSGASFLTTVLIGRYTVPSQLGTYALAASVLIWVTNAQESLVSLPFTLRRSSEPGEATVQAGQAAILSGVLSALAIVAIAIAGIATLAPGGHQNLIPIAWALAGAVPFVIHRDFARRFAFADLRNTEALALDGAVVIVQFGLLGWLAWTGRMSSAAALVALGFSCATAVLIWFWLVRDRFELVLDGFTKTLRDSWELGRWLLANQFLGTLQSQMTLWIVALAVGTTATGIYAACMSIALFANPIILGISNVLWAKAVRAFQQGGSARLLHESISDAGQLGALIGLFFLAILLWGDDLLNLLYPESHYGGYAHVVTILALSQLIYGLGMPASTALGGIGQVRTNFIVEAIEATLMGLLVVALVSQWGIVGAAYGVLTGQIIRLFICWAALLSVLPSADRTMVQARGVETLAPILRRLAGGNQAFKLEVLDLAGCDSHVFAATSEPPGCNIDATYIIKLYKPDRNLEPGEIRAQYESFRRIHAALNGHIFHDWRICVPTPVLMSHAPLALVMMRAPGRKLVACLHDRTAGKETEHPVTLAFSAAMMNLWAAGLSHGDLNIGNVLCDEQTHSLSFVDCGPMSGCGAYLEARCRRDLAIHDLAHLLAHEGKTLSRTWGRPNRLRQRQLFVEAVLRTVLAAEPSDADKTTFLSELSRCARAHLADPARIHNHLGWWRSLKRAMALRRMNAILKRVEQDIREESRSIGEPAASAPQSAATAAGCHDPSVRGERHEAVLLQKAPSKNPRLGSRGWYRNQDWSLSQPGEAVGRIRQLLSAELKYLVGIDSHLDTEDRRVLEESIFPYFLRDDRYRNVLFVGCSWCTRGYNRPFERQKNYSTIDSCAWKRRYGAKRHIVAPLQDLGRHVPANTLDLIICNGVYGWGLNDRAEIEAAFTACRQSLREDGILIIGWDDCERLNPCPLATWECLRGFRRFVFPPLRTSEFVTGTPLRHTYSFYRRPRAAELTDGPG